MVWSGMLCNWFFLVCLSGRVVWCGVSNWESGLVCLTDVVCVSGMVCKL